MQQELEALLAVQADDLEIHGLEERLAALQPRLKELDQRRTRIENRQLVHGKSPRLLPVTLRPAKPVVEW